MRRGPAPPHVLSHHPRIEAGPVDAGEAKGANEACKLTDLADGLPAKEKLHLHLWEWVADWDEQAGAAATGRRRLAPI